MNLQITSSICHTTAIVNSADPRDAFFRAAVLYGDLAEAAALLAAHPELARGDIHTAALLGDRDTLQRCLTAAPEQARDTSNPLGWEPLTLLCFSRFLRLEPARSEEFMACARLLLDAGADPNGGFYDSTHSPEPMHESVLYGAAGIAHHAPLTRLLLERGADPNDNEVPYHAPESYDLEALRAILETGKLDADRLSWVLVRKADWHHYEGLELALRHGADPNRMTMWGYTALHQTLRRDNQLANVELLLRHGGDPAAMTRDGHSAFALAAMRGRGDVLALLRPQHGLPLEGELRFLAACALDEDAPPIPFLNTAGARLAEFAGNGNTRGVARLLDYGIPVDSLYGGDGYFEIPRNSTALHVAAWRGRHETVRLLMERGADIHRPDGAGRTPLTLAIRAATVSHWAARCGDESIRALRAAGAE